MSQYTSSTVILSLKKSLRCYSPVQKIRELETLSDHTGHIYSTACDNPAIFPMTIPSAIYLHRDAMTGDCAYMYTFARTHHDHLLPLVV